MNALYGLRGYYVMHVIFLTKEDLHEMKHNYGMKEIWKFATKPKTHTARNKIAALARKI